MTRALDDQKIAWIVDHMTCDDCMNEDLEYDHRPDECPLNSACCGARLDSDMEGFCPACGEAC